MLVVRRLRCSKCRNIHHELPDCIVPYKRYESSCIEEVVPEPDASVVAADDATLRHRKTGSGGSAHISSCSSHPFLLFAFIRSLWRTRPSLRSLHINESGTTSVMPPAD
ncbi:DUF6431 domain-containing protein [Paenibacillus andongensis]|uniref:DUF6431 domain-containing protein n=1 Tax=Paenibacillus andongensis TaxID=2975482 RepID=UPI0034619CBB